ncbi:MAG: hypothetical protein EAX96_19665 [Candidatus Lokiarchaeota archaeon]|nr:hypothetical protein [Candidatus Lokiarchaeota archaeon]
MDPILKTILIIFGWLTTGLTVGSIIYWKKEEVVENKWNMLYLGFFGLFVIIDIIINFSGNIQMFSPGLAIYMVGNLIRKDEWPNDPKFTQYYKIFILLLAATLTSSLMLITFSDLTYARMGLIEITDFSGLAIVSMTPWIMPVLIIVISDPTNRYGNRETDRIIGGLLALLGVFLGMLIGLLLLVASAGYVLDALAIILAITALVSGTLIFMTIFLGNV